MKWQFLAWPQIENDLIRVDDAKSTCAVLIAASIQRYRIAEK
jgi:hypothetical protein